MHPASHQFSLLCFITFHNQYIRAVSIFLSLLLYMDKPFVCTSPTAYMFRSSSTSCIVNFSLCVQVMFCVEMKKPGQHIGCHQALHPLQWANGFSELSFPPKTFASKYLQLHSLDFQTVKHSPFVMVNISQGCYGFSKCKSTPVHIKSHGWPMEIPFSLLPFSQIHLLFFPNPFTRQSGELLLTPPVTLFLRLCFVPPF